LSVKRHRREVYSLSVHAPPQAKRPCYHYFEMQGVVLQNIQRAAVTIGNVHGGVYNGFKQLVYIFFFRQRDAYIK
jgi:hypothetical protein